MEGEEYLLPTYPISESLIVGVIRGRFYLGLTLLWAASKSLLSGSETLKLWHYINLQTNIAKFKLHNPSASHLMA